MQKYEQNVIGECFKGQIRVRSYEQNRQNKKNMINEGASRL